MMAKRKRQTRDLPRISIYVKVQDPSNWSAYVDGRVGTATNVDLTSIVKEDARKYERSWRILAGR